MKVWITKYAMSSGVYLTDVDLFDDKPNMCVMRGSSKEKTYDQYFHGNDWHLLETNAKTRFEEMKQKKIASLKKTAQEG